MKAAFSHGWRLLLVLALAFNPLAAAFAMAADRDEATASAGSAEVPPWHGMDHAAAMSDPADSTESSDHGCDCGNAACQFGACCGVGALVPSIHFVAVNHARNHLTPSASGDGAVPPPPSRLIRPPIA